MSPDYVAGALTTLGAVALVYAVAVSICDGINEYRWFERIPK